jgi:hypothetical protein
LAPTPAPATSVRQAASSPAPPPARSSAIARTPNEHVIRHATAVIGLLRQAPLTSLRKARARVREKLGNGDDTMTDAALVWLEQAGALARRSTGIANVYELRDEGRIPEPVRNALASSVAAPAAHSRDQALEQRVATLERSLAQAMDGIAELRAELERRLGPLPPANK